MEVKLDGKTEKLVQKEIEAGRFPDAGSLVGVAVEHYLIAREFGEEYTREEIREKIERGWTQLEGGQSVDGEEFFEQLRIRGHELKSRGK